MRQSLERRRGVIADVLAVLQRMGRSPPPAILVRPHDMTQAIRAAMLLGAVIPDLKSETVALAQDLEELANLRASIAERTQDPRRARREPGERQAAADGAGRGAPAIAGRRRTGVGLRTRPRRGSGAAGRHSQRIDRPHGGRNRSGQSGGGGGARGRRSGGGRRQDARGGGADQDPARLKPAIPFADARGTIALPAAGAIVKTFGSPDAFGGAEKGVSIATPEAATVASPIDGWIAFSGPYRTYGQLLIINAGGGYYMVLAGMDRINVGVGQFVLAGEPVAAMGAGSARTAAAAAIGAAQPILYIELRKDGAAIDPGPWWAKTDIEKARG